MRGENFKSDSYFPRAALSRPSASWLLPNLFPGDESPNPRWVPGFCSSRVPASSRVQKSEIVLVQYKRCIILLSRARTVRGARFSTSSTLLAPSMCKRLNDVLHLNIFSAHRYVLPGSPHLCNRGASRLILSRHSETAITANLSDSAIRSGDSSWLARIRTGIVPASVFTPSGSTVLQRPSPASGTRAGRPTPPVYFSLRPVNAKRTPRPRRPESRDRARPQRRRRGTQRNVAWASLLPI